MADYPWPLNHTDEDPVGKKRNISYGANTAGTGLIKQQSDSSPLVLRWKGRILEESQNQAFWEWFQLCESQTIYVEDFAGAQYEVTISDYEPTRRGVVRNSRGGTTNPDYIYEYTLEMQVIRVISGPAAGITP